MTKTSKCALTILSKRHSSTMLKDVYHLLSKERALPLQYKRVKEILPKIVPEVANALIKLLIAPIKVSSLLSKTSLIDLFRLITVAEGGSSVRQTVELSRQRSYRLGW